MKSLAKIRAEIEVTQAEALRVKHALPPIADIESTVRHVLSEMAGAQRKLITTTATIFSHGMSASELTALPATQLPKHAFGLAISAIGVEEIITQAKEIAAINDSGAMRLSAGEREERLDDLQRHLYELELAEEQRLAGAPRRPEANPAAVLGVPVDVAADYGFLTVKG